MHAGVEQHPVIVHGHEPSTGADVRVWIQIRDVHAAGNKTTWTPGRNENCCKIADYKQVSLPGDYACFCILRDHSSVVRATPKAFGVGCISIVKLSRFR